ncbi:hypothetical protein CPB86DRAFT_88089 [Serendipita vermifera]|nr:hypothetical protein CPB86DRAFT_88089 [Serendipita vermifera]
MFKRALYALTVLAASTLVAAQCTNDACTSANTDYKTCKLITVSSAAFKTCLCTKKFLVNYDRCIKGTICAWDGDPATIGDPCPAIVCPGTFDGGFDAAAFCAGSTSSIFCAYVPCTEPLFTKLPPQLNQSKRYNLTCY